MPIDVTEGFREDFGLCVGERGGEGAFVAGVERGSGESGADFGGIVICIFDMTFRGVYIKEIADHGAEAGIASMFNKLKISTKHKRHQRGIKMKVERIPEDEERAANGGDEFCHAESQAP